MKYIHLTLLYCLAANILKAQSPAPTKEEARNIYVIRQALLADPELQDSRKAKDQDDDGLVRFNRWFHEVEMRAYPSGNLPPADALIKAYRQEADARLRLTGAKQTGGGTAWKPLGPLTVPNNYNGLGRVNCVVINPLDYKTLYIGTAGGGLFISHDEGATWPVHSDDFPSMSVAAIAVNPVHPDTLYAATGDEYGYETTAFRVFWGGLYSAGIIKSTDGGLTWAVTGFTLQQSDREIVQSLLVHPTKTNVLLAATRHGIFRTADAGATWQQVDTGHVYSMAFRPQTPDTVYAVSDFNLRVSYNAGLNWHTQFPNINTADTNVRNRRATIAVTPAAPNAIWVLNKYNDLRVSHNNGISFSPPNVNMPGGAGYYGYYDRVLTVSPTDSNKIITCGMSIAESAGGNTWNLLDPSMFVHVDYHAALYSPFNAATIYTCNDGGIFRSRTGGATWENLSYNLNIAQIYRMSASRQDPAKLLCGLQDNSTFSFDGTNWSVNIGGDGEACAISPKDDNVQVGSYQYGHFFLSTDQGFSFNPLNISGAGLADWTAPVAFSPNSADTIYFGMKNIYVTRDRGVTFTNLHPSGFLFTTGATCLSVAPSRPTTIYAADQGRIVSTTDGGATWNNITGNLPSDSVAITRIAVDFKKPDRVFVTTSGYKAGQKVYYSTTGGGTWINISGNLPNIPANCIAVDSSSKGGLFVGTDLGIYYSDSSSGGTWSPFHAGLPNVIVNDIDINYTAYKIRVATYGRGIWETDLKSHTAGIGQASPPARYPVQLYPNPTGQYWNLQFPNGIPPYFSVRITDMSGRQVFAAEHTTRLDVARLPEGAYIVDVALDGQHYRLKGIRE